MGNTHALYAVSVEPTARPNDDQKGITVPSPACPLCSGTTWEFVEGKGVRPCGCRLKERRDKLIADARIPKLYVDSSLQNYQPSTQEPSQLRAYNYAHALVRDYPAVDRGILLMGESGVGKTHLSVAILRALIEKGIECRFYEYRSLLKEIQSSYNPNTNTSEMEVLAPLFECEVVALDELGAAKPTQWVQDTIGLIINSRYNEKKLTILTTNYLDQRQASMDETLGDRIGTRLRSRLYQMCKTVLIEGEDYRRRFDGQIV
jgi:DNA replication protein DnaC